MSNLTLPPADRTHSPITGYVREHWIVAADQMLLAVRAYASPGRAQIALPGASSNSGPASDALEGFARTFLLAAFRTAGEQGEDPWGHLSRYREGLLAGTNPHSAEPWPAIEDHGQPLVEAASIALGLHFTRPWLWEALDAPQQAQICSWLHQASGIDTPRNNWVLFKVIVQEFLASCGWWFNTTDIENGLETLDSWYVGDGWYRDGAGDRFDYYNGWALHLYPLLWTEMAAGRDATLAAERRDTYRQRLRLHLGDYVHFFGGNGAPILQGRSLIYRAATVAPLWMGELHGVSPVEPGTVRRLASGTLRHFVDSGAFDSNGLLTLGWHREFRPMTQSYSGPASPYWMSKGFLGLLLPKTHPVWADTEQAAPVERSDGQRSMSGPGFRITSTSEDGIARLTNHGSDNYPPITDGDDPNYSRFAYSTHTAPVFGAGLSDNHFAIMDARGVPSRRVRIHRENPHQPDTQVSTHYPVWDGQHGQNGYGCDDWAITTAVTTRGPFELRLHRVRSAHTTPTAVRETGFAANRHGSLASILIPLHGYETSGQTALTGVSPLSDEVTVPWATGVHSGEVSYFASLVILSKSGSAKVRPDTLQPRFSQDAASASFCITLPDEHQLQLTLPLE